MFVNINIEDVQIVSLKQCLNGWNGGTHHALWLNPRGAVIFDGGDDFPTVRRSIRLVGNENSAGAVVERAGVSCGDPAFLVEDGTQVRQRFIRRVTPHAFVVRGQRTWYKDMDVRIGIGLIAVNGVPMVVSGTPEHVQATCPRHAVLAPGRTKKEQLANTIYRTTGLSTDDLLAVLPGACDVIEEYGMLTPPAQEEE